MRIAFALVLLAATAEPKLPELEAVSYSLRAVYALAADMEAYRTAHGRLPAAKSVTELERTLYGEHGQAEFGTTDTWNTPLFVESDPERNSYTVAAAGSDKTFDRTTWSSSAKTRNTADDIVIRDGAVVRSPEAWADEMLRASGFDVEKARAAGRETPDPRHTRMLMWQLKAAVEDYFEAHHTYPDLTTLRKLAVQKAMDPQEDPMADAWGTPFLIRFTPQSSMYRIVSAGTNKTFETSRWDETTSTTDYSRDLVMINGKIVGDWETHPAADMLAERLYTLAEVRKKFVALTSAGPKERRAGRLAGLMDEVAEALKAGDVPGAVTKYEEAVRFEPAFVDADKLSSIASYLTNAALTTPPPPPPPSSKGPPRTIKNDPALRDAAKRLVPLVQKAIDSSPKDFNLAAALAGLQYDLGDKDAARGAVDRYAAANPSELRVHLLRTRIGATSRDYDDAARALDAALVSSKDDLPALYVGGVIGYEMAEHNVIPPAARIAIIVAARKLLERAIAVKSDNFEAMAYLNLLLRQQARVETDPARQKALTDEADRVRAQAVEIIKNRKAKSGG
jgi:tetratricopeptide (TPR) repeat protein